MSTIIFEKYVDCKIRSIYEQREEILRAFVAKHGCQPEEVHQVIEQYPDKIIWRVQKSQRFVKSEQIQKMNIRTMIRLGFKFSIDTDNWGRKYFRWYSDKFGEDGREYWFVFELGRRTGKEYGIAFCWLHWNFGGSDQIVHIPNISQIQTVDGLLKMMYGLGYPEITLRTDEDVEERYQRNKDKYAEFKEGV